jgi:hypothetical protein
VASITLMSSRHAVGQSLPEGQEVVECPEERVWHYIKGLERYIYI